MYERYGVSAEAPFPLDNPGIVSIPLSFIVLIAVSLATQPKAVLVRSAAATD